MSILFWFRIFSFVCLFSSFGLVTESQWSHDPGEYKKILIGAINPVMVSDGFGGAIVAASMWVVHDYIVVQRVDHDGYILWDETLHGIPVAEKDPEDVTRHAYLLADGYGGVFIAYGYVRIVGPYPYDSDVYVQHIDSSGSVLWGDRGIAVCTLAGYQEPVGLVTDGQDGLIVVWSGWVGGGSQETYGQRVSPEGDILWEEKGILVSNRRLELAVTDGVGGAILMPDYGPGGQRINGNGELLWNEEEIDADVGYFREMVADGFGNVILSGRKTDELGLGLFAQKMDSNGNVLWGDGGVRITPVVDSQTFRAKIAVDSLGNAVFAWRDRRTGDFNVYTQKLNTLGEIQWDEGGIKISSYESGKSDPEIVNSIPGENIFVWRDWRNDSWPDLYSQRFNEFGEVFWPSDDVAICTPENVPYDHQIIGNESGGAIIVWYFAAEGRGIYAAMVDSFGILGGGSKGDLNGDASIDILDVVRLINIIFEIPPAPTEYELWSGDLNQDDRINILDVVLLIDEILAANSNSGFKESDIHDYNPWWEILDWLGR